jgi:raffinose/stachyose/melibiose transport system substrate-binding protein
MYVPKTGNAANQKAAISFVNYVGGGAGYQYYLNKSLDYPLYKGFKTPTGQLQAVAEGYQWYLHHSTAVFSQALRANYGNMPGYISQLVAGQMTPLQVAQNLQQQFVISAKAEGLPGF